MGNILLIEDDAALSESMSLHLQKEGYNVTVCEDGLSGLSVIRREAPDLLLLDLLLPGMDGFDVCRTIRRTYNFPIIMVSGMDKEVDRVLGLEIGADDYIAKPFSMAEMVARVKAVLRRTAGSDGFPDTLANSEIVVNRTSREVTVRGEVVDLRPKEFALLLLLIESKGRVIARGELASKLWGGQSEVGEGTLDVHIRRLREKIELDPSQPRHILTVRSLGYKFRE